MSKDRIFIQALTTKRMKQRMVDAVENGLFISESDLIRIAVRKLLDEENKRE